MGYTTVSGGSRATVPGPGILASDLAVGSVVKLIENGTPIEYMVVNQGIPANSNLYDSSCNGTWLLRKDLHSERQWHTTGTNDYKNSSINAWLNGEFYNSLGDIEKGVIKQVKIPYRAGSGYSGNITGGSDGLSTKIFLLSSLEVNWSRSTDSSIPNEGACLSYFSGCTTFDNKRIAYLNGSVAEWWLRSPWCHSTAAGQCAMSARTDGCYNLSYCYLLFGIRPALVLPSYALFNNSTLMLKEVRGNG